MPHLSKSKNDYLTANKYTNIRCFSLTAGLNKLECGAMPNVMAALPNIGGALCSMPQSFTDAHY